MRATRLVMIIVWSVVALLIVTAIVGWILFSGGGSGSTREMIRGEKNGMELMVQERFDGNGIDAFELDLGSDDVDIYASESGELVVMQYGLNLSEDRIISASQRGSTVKVERGSGSFFSFGIGITKSQVEVYLPEKIYKELDLHLSSGSMYIHADLSADRFNVKLSSGNIKSISKIAADRAEVRVTSGNARLGDLEAEKYELDISSGLLEVTSLTGSGTTNLTSGNMRLLSVEITDSLSCKVSSGNMKLALAGSPNLEFTGKKSSGSLRTYFEHYSDTKDKEVFATVGAGPYVDLFVQVTSGDVRITEA